MLQRQRVVQINELLIINSHHLPQAELRKIPYFRGFVKASGLILAFKLDIFGIFLCGENMLFTCT